VDIIRCGRVDDKESYRNCLGLSAITKNGMEVNVAASGNLFPGESIYWLIVWDHGGVGDLEFLVCCPIKDVDGTALVNEDFLDGIIFYLNDDDHRVILLVINAMKIVVREGYGGHATFVMRMGDVVDGLDMVEVSLPGG